MDTGVVVDAQANRPTKNLAQSRLRQVCNNSSRFEDKNRVAVVRKQVKTFVGRKESVNSLNCSHDHVGFFFQCRPSNLGVTKVSREESKWLMTLIDALKRHVRNGNLGDDTSPEKFGCVGLDTQSFGCVDMRKRNLELESSLTRTERVFMFLAQWWNCREIPATAKRVRFPAVL